jgi:hypothetical protein
MKLKIWQVDKGFVAQVADVVGGRSAPMNEEQIKEAKKTVVGEFSDVKHVRGILSMGRLSSSFFFVEIYCLFLSYTVQIILSKGLIETWM